MSIKIFTYTNPYALEEEGFWDSIRGCPHFCVSQTLVNGMKETYDCFNVNLNITTIRNLVNQLYKQWENVGIKVKQMIEVDNAIESLDIQSKNIEATKRSLYNNTKSIANSIRILSELNLNPFNFKDENVNIDQQYLIDIFKIIYKNKHSSFMFVRDFSEGEIDKAIRTALLQAGDGLSQTETQIDKIDTKTVVIHGVHQFTPAMLCAIEDIAKYKDVVLIFNYQKQYQKVYQTWLDVYSCFNEVIKLSTNEEFEPNALLGDSYNANVMADCIGKMSDCCYNEHNEELDNIEVLEFENNTEFANYVAEIFENALTAKKANPQSKSSPLRYMTEQFYSASTRVNDILRAYYPEQFEQRHFLDYPIGHFFVATMDLWDYERQELVVNNFSDVKECLTAGILTESKDGLLINTFNKIVPYVADLKRYSDIVAKLKTLKKHLPVAHPEKKKVGYFNVKYEDLAELILALDELRQIIEFFYKDFNSDGQNFQSFYGKVKNFISDKVSTNTDFDQEMVDVMRKLLERIGQTDIPQSGSFITLKQTLNYYLSQDENINSGAKWIVRGFEQIDGDVLKSSKKADGAIYHFCCLSDKDICANKDERLPWPLDVSFFEYIQVPLDWKHEMYVKTKTEYHNFNRYALLYGLEFCRNKCRLSYVRRENDKENELYHILSMLGIKIKKYSSYEKSGYLPSLIYPKQPECDLSTYIESLDELSKIKMAVCPYKFGIEQIAQEHTIFRDRFLIHTYMRVLIRNKALYNLQGKSTNDHIIRNEIKAAFDDINNKFRLCNSLEEAQLIAQIYKDVNKGFYKKDKQFKSFNVDLLKKMTRDEDLLDYTAEKDLIHLSKEELMSIMSKHELRCFSGEYCKYCASKDVCLENKN